jgi:hypothetical protein
MQKFMSLLRKTKMNFNFQPPSTFVFSVFYKNDIIEGCSPFEDIAA